MSFNGVFLTNKGKNLLAKAQSGAQITFTNIRVGDGELGATPIDNLTALVNEVKSLNIAKLKTLPSGKAVVGAVLSNQDLVEGFYWREIGIFAQDPDEGEILYAYGHSGGTAEYIPPTSNPVINKVIDIVTITGNAENITAVIDESAVYVLLSEFNEHAYDEIIHVTQTDRDRWDAAETSAKSYIDIKLAELIDEAPEALNTLKKLANALGEDANFSTTIINMINGIAGTGRTTETVKGNADGLANHIEKTASISEKGHVQLYNGTDSTSASFAATANAVKAAYDRANEAFQYANDGKTAVANAVTAKGVSASPTDTFATLAAKIGQISTGKKTAEGEVTVTLNNNETYTVSGLDFVPKIVLSSALLTDGDYDYCWVTLSAKMKDYYSGTYEWKFFVDRESYYGMYVPQEPTSNQIIFKCNSGSTRTLKKFWYLAIEG